MGGPLPGWAPPQPAEHGARAPGRWAVHNFPACYDSVPVAQAVYPVLVTKCHIPSGVAGGNCLVPVSPDWLQTRGRASGWGQLAVSRPSVRGSRNPERGSGEGMRSQRLSCCVSV